MDQLQKIFNQLRETLSSLLAKAVGVSGEVFDPAEKIFGPYALQFKAISFVISVIFFVLMMFFLIRSGYLARRIDIMNDFWRMQDVFKRRSVRAWVRIKKKLKSKNPNDWREALMTAEVLLNMVLKQAGFPGKNLDDRLAGLNQEQLSNLADVRKAHLALMKMQENPSQEVSPEEIEGLLDIYEEALREMGLLG